MDVPLLRRLLGERERKRGNFLHVRTKVVILTEDDGEISRYAHAGSGLPAVNLG